MDDNAFQGESVDLYAQFGRQVEEGDPGQLSRWRLWRGRGKRAMGQRHVGMKQKYVAGEEMVEEFPDGARTIIRRCRCCGTEGKGRKRRARVESLLR